MALTRDFRETIKERAENDPEFRVALLTEIVLSKVDGTTINLLPTTTRVDFAEYVEISELLSVTSAPLGSYDEVVLGLDFTNSEIIVQDANGKGPAEKSAQIAQIAGPGPFLRPLSHSPPSVGLLWASDFCLHLQG